MASAGKVNRRENLRKKSTTLKSPGWTSGTDCFFETPGHKNNRKRGSMANILENSPYSPPKTRRSTMFVSIIQQDTHEDSPTSTISEAGSSSPPVMEKEFAPTKRKIAASIAAKSKSKGSQIVKKYEKKVPAKAKAPVKKTKTAESKSIDVENNNDDEHSHKISVNSEIEVKRKSPPLKKTKTAKTKHASSRKTDLEDDKLIALAQEMAKVDERLRRKRKVVDVPTLASVRKLRVQAIRLEEDVQLTSSPIYRSKIVSSRHESPPKSPNNEDTTTDENQMETSDLSVNASTVSASNSKCVIL